MTPTKRPSRSARRGAARCLVIVGLLALAPPAHAQERGLLAQYFGDGEDAAVAAYLWVDTFHEVGDAVAGLEQAAGLPAGEMTITLGSYYDEPFPARDELARRGLVRVARSGSVGAARLGATAGAMALLSPAGSRDRLRDLFQGQVAPLQDVLRQAADLATEALVCGDAPTRAATACGDPVDPVVWLQFRDQIGVLSTTFERALSGGDHASDD